MRLVSSCWKERSTFFRVLTTCLAFKSWEAYSYALSCNWAYHKNSFVLRTMLSNLLRQLSSLFTSSLFRLLMPLCHCCLKFTYLTYLFSLFNKHSSYYSSIYSLNFLLCLKCSFFLISSSSSSVSLSLFRFMI